MLPRCDLIVMGLAHNGFAQRSGLALLVAVNGSFSHSPGSVGGEPSLSKVRVVNAFIGLSVATS